MQYGMCLGKPEMSDSIYSVRHNTRCADCNADLTRPNSIRVHISTGGREFDVLSCVGSDGRLIDTDRLVENGYHAGSWCVECDGLIEEVD